MKSDICPRCGENAIRTIISPERKVKLVPERNVLMVGDTRRDDCGVCHWWSEAKWNGHAWKWQTAPKQGPKQKALLDLRLLRIKKKRRAFGGKGK